MIAGCVLVVTALSLLGSTARGAVRLSHSDDLTQIGQTTRVRCTVTGETFKGWSKVGGAQIPQSGRVSVSSSADVHTLAITQAQLSDGGIYRCSGSNNQADYTFYLKFETANVDTVQHIKIGQTGKVHLSVIGYPTPQFKWSKNKVHLDTSASRYRVGQDGSLQITNVKMSDQGNYSCLISQLGGRVEEEKDIEVFVVDPPKIIQQPNPPRRYLTQGYNTTFQCKASGSPSPKYTWLNPNGGEISSFGRFVIEDGNLIIKDIQPSDKGRYTCKAYSVIERTGENIGEVRTSADIIEVYVKPQIIGLEKVTELEKGDSYVLTCSATGTPLPTVVWRRGGVRDPRQQTSDGKSVINFRNIQVIDSGEYTCEATNKAVDSAGNPIVVQGTTHINIQSKPMINWQASPKEVYSFVGNDIPVSVTCSYYGFPAPWVIMKKDGVLVVNASTTATAKLTTNAAKYFGVYNCFAQNKFGMQNYSVELNYAGPPGTVRALRAESTCDSVTFTWEKPEIDGGLPVKSYVLNFGDTTRSIDGMETSYKVTGLERNSRYLFSLRATNRAKWGPKTSTGVKTKEFCRPGRPIIYSPQSTELDSDSFTLMWKRPEETGGDPTISYRVRYTEIRADGTGDVTEKTTTDLKLEITGLKLQTKYKFEVFATNKGGDSEPAIATYQVPSVRAGSVSQSLLPASSVMLASIAGILYKL